MGISDMTNKWTKSVTQKRVESKKHRRITEQEEIDWLYEQYKAGEHYLNVYVKYLRSLYWKRIRLEVLKRDKFACVKCGSKKDLHVDHIKYGPWGDENIVDLQTLCRVCHQKKTTHFILCDGTKFKTASARSPCGSTTPTPFPA
jgi:hypothetical protein